MLRTIHWAALLMVGAAIAGCAAPPAPMLGTPVSVGKGEITSYAEADAAGVPRAIGVMFAAAALEDLPAESTDRHHCFDVNRNGRIDPAKECVASHEWVLPLPSDLARRPDMPFKWVLLNWNPHGHIPPGVYDTPHFDVHFVIEPIANIFAIKAGPCGPELVRCDQFAIGRKPVPVNYMPASHVDVGAVVPAMGNHLVDVAGPEFKGEKFKRAWIYGVYDGRVTFYEEMVDRAYLLSKPSTCFPIPSPEAVAVAGYYPTQSCIRFVADKNAYTVSLEAFVLRRAGAPGAPRAVPPLPPQPPAPKPRRT